MAGENNVKFSILVSVLGEQAVKNLQGSIKGVGDAAGGLQKGIASLKTGIAALGAAFAVREVAGFVKGIIDTADGLRDLSQKTQVSVSDLSGFKVAAEQSGTTIENLAPAFAKLNKNLVAAAAGNDEARSGFEKLGISVRDASGAIRPTGDVVKDIAEKFSNLKDSPQKAAAAIALFGKSGAELLPFLNNGRDALEKFKGAISDDFANRADQLNDTLAELKAASLQGITKAIAPLLPTLQQLVESFQALMNGSDGLRVVFIGLGEVLRILTAGFETTYLGAGILVDAIIEISSAIKDTLIAAVQVATVNLETFAKAAKAIVSLDFSGALSDVKSGFQQLGNIGDDFYQKQSDRAGQFVDRLVEKSKTGAAAIQKATQDSIIAGLAAGKSISEILAAQQVNTAPKVKRATLSAPEIDPQTAKRLQDELNSAKALLEVGRAEYEIERLKATAYGLSSAELDRLIETKKTEAEVAKNTKNFTEQGKKAYQESAQAVLELKLQIIDLKEAQKQSFSAGIQQGLRDYIDKVKDVASQTKEAFNRAFDGLTDSLTEFVKTGKLNFKDLADSIITDIIRISIRQAVIAPLLGGIGSIFSGSTGSAAASAGGSYANVAGFAANGGIMTSKGFARLNSYANGGVASSPQLAIFGEGRTPEAYVPLPDGRSIPVTMKDSSGSGGVAVTVNVALNGGQDQVTSNGDSKRDGKQLGILISNAVKAELIKQKLPGGILA